MGNNRSHLSFAFVASAQTGRPQVIKPAGTTLLPLDLMPFARLMRSHTGNSNARLVGCCCGKLSATAAVCASPSQQESHHRIRLQHKRRATKSPDAIHISRIRCLSKLSPSNTGMAPTTSSQRATSSRAPVRLANQSSRLERPSAPMAWDGRRSVYKRCCLRRVARELRGNSDRANPDAPHTKNSWYCAREMAAP
jgi:hypothetical protein